MALAPRSLARLLDTACNELVKHATYVRADVTRRERPRLPDGTLDPNGYGDGWGPRERDRRTATSAVINGLDASIQGLRTAILGLLALDEIDRAPAPKTDDAAAHFGDAVRRRYP